MSGTSSVSVLVALAILWREGEGYLGPDGYLYLGGEWKGPCILRLDVPIIACHADDKSTYPTGGAPITSC